MSSSSSSRSIGRRVVVGSARGSSRTGRPDSACTSREFLQPGNSGMTSRSFCSVVDSAQDAIANVMPSLTKFLRKGDCGKICIVGGSNTSAGPPFFAGDGALQCGACEVVVLTTSSAAIPLKCYSSELTVIPYLPEKYGATSSKFIDRVWPMIEDSHAFCIGPGLGEDKVTLNAVRKLIGKISNSYTPMVLNSGALQLLNSKTDLLSSDLLHTPAVVILEEVEFVRVWKTLRSSDIMSFRSSMADVLTVPSDIDCPIGQQFSVTEYRQFRSLLQTAQVASALGSNVVITRVGLFDITAHSGRCFVFGGVNLKNRCSNQGDLLAGVVTTLLAWQKLNGVPNKPMIAVSNAGFILRLAALDAFGSIRRGAIASDVANFIPGVLTNLAAVYDNKSCTPSTKEEESTSSASESIH